MEEILGDAVPCGLTSFRDDGTMLTANAALAEMVGVAKYELIGRRLESLFNVAGRIFFQTHLMPLLRMSGRIEEAHVSLLERDGQELPVLLNAARRATNDGFVNHAAIAPMRRRLRHEDEILAAKRAAEAATAEKEAANAALRTLQATLEQRVAERTQDLVAANAEMESFSYSIAHDLRAPLRAISSSSHILLEEAAPALSEEHRSQLERQASNAVRLGRLIDDLLQFSRLSRAPFERVPIDFTGLAHEIAQGGELAIASERCKFEIQPAMRAVGDPYLLRQVLSHLMQNACKFSPDGGKVSVTQRCIGDESVYAVSDEGLGFDMRYADKLFVPFQRLVADHEYPGTGIGLASVQRIVRRHGGRVWAEGEVGKGSTFSFTLGQICTF